MEHRLKTVPPYFQDVWDLEKKFELRRNDRDFAKGDTLILCEWDGYGYTGREVEVEVGYILENAEGFGLAEGHVIMEIKAVSWHPATPTNERKER